MPALSFAPALSLLMAFGHGSPVQPLRTLMRTTGRRFNPPRREVLTSAAGPAVRAVLASGAADAEALATVRVERRKGQVPTIVLGGFVPDAAEQVYLLRGHLVRQGSVYYVDYSRTKFSMELIAAQLDDLVSEVTVREGAAPVMVAVSFGAGVVLDWLRRARLAGRKPAPGGIILVSPVCSAEDLLTPGEAKPSTLLGRAVKPMLEATGEVPPEAIERARAIFARMFEAGAQNKMAMAALLTRAELAEVRDGVMATIAGISPQGAVERVRALRQMMTPSSYLTPELLPLCDAPTLVLYAEKESAVITERSPARFVLEHACGAFFPQGECRVVRNPRGTPVQHASLLFHVANFQPYFGRFYRALKGRKLLKAA